MCSDLYINGTKMRKKRLMIEIGLLNSWSDFLNFLLSLMFPKPLRLEFKEQENKVNEESSWAYKECLQRWLQSNSYCM